MPDDADLTLEALVKMVADFLAELDLRDVTLVCNDWGGAQLVVSPGGSDRVANLVLVSCEAFDNYPPGLPGRLLCLIASLPGGTFLTAQLLRPRFLRHLPITFGGLSKKRVPDDQFLSWIESLRHDRTVRRDLHKYLRSVPKRTQLLDWAEEQRAFTGQVLVVWAREDKLMPPEHAERLAEWFENTELVWVDDSRTLIPIDQPEVLTAHLQRFFEQCGQGLAVSPGTLADSLKRFVPLFEPLADGVLAHQNEAALRHADETSWRVQELRGEDRSSRAWLWISVSSDAVCFHIDPSRSAEAAHKLFAEALLYTVIVCDRYSAYKRLARLLGGLVTLAFCWAHQRRDFIECAAGQVGLTQWCRGWIERIASIYRLNDARLEHYDPGIEPQTPAFDAAQGALNEALDALFADAERELAGLPDQAREGKALRSLLNHREGLSVFIDRPQVPLDNNLAERLLRGPAIGRRLSFGSDSETGARFTALMYSVVGTLSLNDIDVLRWLQAWLETCAKNGGTPPDDLSPWLPWSMSEERRRSFTAPA